MTAQAKETAKTVKANLSKLYPGVKFSVRFYWSTHTPCLNVSWVDGPKRGEVLSFVEQYAEYGDFKCDDSWERKPNVNTGIRLVTVDRGLSQNTVNCVSSFLAECFDMWKANHSAEFSEAISRLYGGGSSWDTVQEKDVLVQWVSDGVEWVKGLADMYEECADF